MLNIVLINIKKTKIIGVNGYEKNYSKCFKYYIIIKYA